MDFTQMPVSQGYKCLLVMIDILTGWIEGFPTWTEKAKEVVQNKKKVLLKIILRFGLPSSLHSDNGTSFTSKVTQGVSKALGITYYLHCSWRPQSSGTSLCLVASVKRGNQLLNSAIKLITQETSLDGRRLYQYLSSAPILPLKPGWSQSLWDAMWETFCLCQWPLSRSRGSDAPSLI